MALALAGALPKEGYIAFVPSVCLLFGYLLLRYAMRLTAEDALSILAQHPNRFVLLLRCFNVDDYRVIGESGFHPSFEETLAHTLRHIGPVIAVGRPEESLPPLGAARLYIESKNWQTEVGKLMEAAQAVVLVLFARQPPQTAQEAKGFRWEVQQALSCVAPKKLLFVLPAATKLVSHAIWFGNRKKAGARARSFESFAEGAKNLAPQLIARHVGDAQFLHFDSSGRLVRLAARRLKYGHAAFADALQPFFQSLGLPPMITSNIVLGWRFSEFFRLVVIIVLCGLVGHVFYRT